MRSFSAINGIAVHWSAEGAADRPALLLSNSLGSDWRIWDGVARRLAGRYRLITYDMRGHGLTDAPTGPYSMVTLAEDVLGLADALDVRRFALAGISVGGMVAQQVALLAPHRLAALVLCNTAPRLGTFASWSQRIAAVETAGIAAIAPAITAGWFSRDFRATRTAEMAGWQNMLLRVHPIGYAGVCAALRDTDLTRAVSAIRVPALAVTGDEDATSTPDLVRAAADLIPGARFELIKGAAHLSCIERPDALAALIADHLTEAGHV